MRSLLVFGARTALTATSALAQLNSTNKDLPACAVQCMAELNFILPKTPANETFICTNQTLDQSLELCVSANCTVKEFLTTKNITEETCHWPLRNRTNTISITATVGLILAMLAIVLRLLSRIKSGKPGMDDWTIIIAMGFVIPLSAMAIVLAGYGLGKDIWSMPFENITHILYIYYLDEVLYLGSLTMIRVSILCLYLRILPQRAFTRSAYAIMAINVLSGTAFILASIFQCIPVHAAWTKWDGTVPAKCINANAVGWTSATINIVLDATIIIFPLPELTRLVMSWERKIYILVMFGLGSLVTIVSILRLTSLVKFANTQNITWDYVPVGYWSTIEVHVSVICACLPTLPSLFRKTPPKMAVSPEPVVYKPKNRDSDILPLIKVISVHEHRVSH